LTELLDTTRPIETPEGVAFELELAGPIPRLYAALIDLFLRGLVMVLAAIPIGFLGNVGVGFYLIGIFLLVWAYPIFFEMYWSGTTPGKRLMGIEVRNDDGTPVSWSSSVVRNLLRVIDFLPILWVTGIGFIAGSRNFQRLGDIAAGTIVCYRHGQGFDGLRDLPEAEPRTTSARLTVEEQRAVVRFAKRTRYWNTARSEEIGEIVEPLTGSPDGRENVLFLRGLAHWIARRR
jgi:uncharacterized RDD family membrane protein YckC